MRNRCDIADDLCASDHSEPGSVSVRDSLEHGSGAWDSLICRPCASVLGIGHGDHIPRNAKRLLQNAQPAHSIDTEQA